MHERVDEQEAKLKMHVGTEHGQLSQQKLTSAVCTIYRVCTRSLVLSSQLYTYMCVPG